MGDGTPSTAILDRSIDGHGARGGAWSGPAGIGKSRLVREMAAMAAGRGVDVFSTFCESHASDVPFHVAARLLRDAAGITDLDDAAARAQVRAGSPMPAMRICCCCTTCSASATPTWRCRTSIPTRGGGG